jgi:predicted nuclease of predicted toxin-antitoxin system
VRFLVAENLSPQLCGYLTAVTVKVEHVHHATGAGTTDQEIFTYAVSHGAVVITADTDFARLLAQAKTTEPSVVLMRELLSLPVAEQGRLLAANLGQVHEALTSGAVVVFSPVGIRVRPLPIN